MVLIYDDFKRISVADCNASYLTHLHPQLTPTMVGAKQVESKINYQKTGIFTPTVGVNGGCKRWVQTVGAINYAIIAGL